jgi:hypothetical protein
MKFWILSTPALVFLTACQLPQRDDVKLDAIPTLDTSTIISSDNGLLSDGISKVPGSICLPDANGKCNPNNMIPSQCLLPNATVEVKPITNPQPAYHSLIDNKYGANASIPFVAPTVSSEYLDEIKAVISGTAQIKSADVNNGYPGIDGLKTCILTAYGPGDYKSVYWISAANIIAVTRSNYKQVSSSLNVSGTGFGANGSTYNHNGDDQENVWIGIYPHPIPVGSITAPAKPADQPGKVVSSTDTTTVVQPKSPPGPLPPAVNQPIVNQPK